jgi:hypothetical protein
MRLKALDGRQRMQFETIPSSSSDYPRALGKNEWCRKLAGFVSLLAAKRMLISIRYMVGLLV